MPRWTIHTAPATVLRSLNERGVLTPLGEADGEELAQIQQDEERGFQDVKEFKAHSVFDGLDMQEMWQLVGERSDWFLLEAEVSLADRNTRLYSVLWRENRTIWTMNRSAGGR